MHTDEQYGHQLGVQLRRELEEVRAAPDLVPMLRRRRARRTWAIRAAITTPVAAAAAAAILVTTVGHGAPDRGPQAGARPANGAVQFENVAYVRAQTVQALGQASQYVIYAKTTYGTGYYEEWIDKATRRYRNDVYGPTYPSYPVGPNGQAMAPPPPSEIEKNLGPIHLIESFSVSGPDGNQNVVTVDYDRKAWWVGHTTDRTSTSVVPDPTDPDRIREALNDGTLQLLGHETVDGLDTLHVRMFAVQRGYRIDMWVDTTTFLPVQETQTVIGAQEPPRVTTTYSWLPRTGENLARLVLTPPPGFQRVK